MVCVLRSLQYYFQNVENAERVNPWHHGIVVSAIYLHFPHLIIQVKKKKEKSLDMLMVKIQ